MEQQYIEIKEYGTSGQLKVESRDFNSTLAPFDVQIDVHYSGINFADIIMRQGLYPDAPSKPFVPGYEISGTVRAVGQSVTDFKVGDQVMAGTHFGGYVSRINIPSHQVVKLPDELDLEQAAALPVNWVTAYIALHEFGRIRKSDTILIDCATGGVGVVAMQMAQTVGAKVYGLTSSPAKKQFIESYGGNALTREEFDSRKDLTFDFVLNSSGGKELKDQFAQLKLSGKICCIGMQAAISGGKKNWFNVAKNLASSPIFPIFKLVMNSKMAGGFNALRYFEDKEWLSEHLPRIREMGITPYVGKVFEAKEVGNAHDFLESRKAKGKVLLKWEH